MSAQVTLPKELLGIILESARRLHPKETIVLLRGRADKNLITVSDVLIPPLATYGKGFSGFPQHMLPMDFSIIGAAHSHPSGNLSPSVEDLNHAMGRVILIAAYPYLREDNVAVYNREGKKLMLRVK